MRPRLGFLGVGWIGSHRMKAIAASGLAEVSALADISAAAVAEAAEETGAEVVTPNVLLDELELDGVVIATPSALHAEQAGRALRRGVAVFCQKPLALTAPEASSITSLARSTDRLLGVDMSYRHLTAVTAMRDVIGDGGIGDVFAAELVFHNAYGPDKAWFHDRHLSGGGCVIDLGIHLVDLASFLLGWPKVEAVTSRLFARGRSLDPDDKAVEDYAVARLDLSTGATVTLSCSWYLNAGCDADISATFHGTAGAVEVHNIAGSFFDFSATLREGTSSSVLVEPPDDWGGRAAVRWAGRLGAGEGFDDEVEQAVVVASIIDRIYAR